MSMRAKLLAAAQAAATEATTNERARCLWCAAEVVRELREKLAKKFLLSAAHEQAAKVKLQIAEAVVMELRRAIISGARPVSATGQEAGAAGFSPEQKLRTQEFLDDLKGGMLEKPADLSHREDDPDRVGQ